MKRITIKWIDGSSEEYYNCNDIQFHTKNMAKIRLANDDTIMVPVRTVKYITVKNENISSGYVVKGDQLTFKGSETPINNLEDYCKITNSHYEKI